LHPRRPLRERCHHKSQHSRHKSANHTMKSTNPSFPFLANRLTTILTSPLHKPINMTIPTAPNGPIKLASVLGIEGETNRLIITRKPKMYGHRGSLYEEPENTIPSFQRAMDHGVQGFELDVFLLKVSLYFVTMMQLYQVIILLITCAPNL
jgi:hypothetical protein